MAKKKRVAKKPPADQKAKSGYYVAEHGVDGDDWAEEYSMLKGPDGFSCCLTEPEDREWYRDLGEVVVRLNEQDAKLHRALEVFADATEWLGRAISSIEQVLRSPDLDATTREFLEALLNTISGARAKLTMALLPAEETGK